MKLKVFRESQQFSHFFTWVKIKHLKIIFENSFREIVFRKSSKELGVHQTKHSCVTS